METLPSADDLSPLEQSLAALRQSADRFGQSLVTAFARGAVAGRSLEDVLRSIGLRFVDMALSAALRPAQSLVGSALSGLAASFAPVRAFADGGVVARPTLFADGGSLGLMGEAGAEAILPLARGADGRLGVRGGGGGTTVNVSIVTGDAESFRRSEAQVAAVLSRAVARGRRAL